MSVRSVSHYAFMFMEYVMKRVCLRITAVMLATVLWFTAFLCFPAGAADAEPTNAIASVTLQNGKNGSELRIEVTLSAHSYQDLQGQTLQLFAFNAAQSVSQIPYMEPAAAFRVEARRTVLTLDCASDPSLLYARFLVAQRYADGSYYVLTDMHYVDNPDFLAVNGAEVPDMLSKKGMNAPTVSDLFPAGANATVITVPVNEYLTSIEGEDTLPIAENEPWLIRCAKLELLDYQIRSLSETGVRVYLQFVLSAPTSSMGDALDCLYATGVNETAIYYAFGIGNEDAARCLIAFFSFMANRYAAKGDNGLCAHWILGDRVNESHPFYYADTAELTALCEDYAMLLRTADIALRSVCADGRVYVPVSNRFCIEDSAAREGVFGAKAFLTTLAQITKKTGDFMWQIASDATPSDLTRGDIRYDPKITANADTPYLTAANLDVMADFLSSDVMLCGNQSRKTLIYRFSLPGEAGDADAEAIQAANYVFAYCQAVRQSCVEGLIYSAFCDGNSPSGIGGLYTGAADDPGEAKKIVRVFRYADTDQNETECAFALPILGAEKWSDLFPDFSLKKCVARRLVETAGVTGTVSDTKVLYDFDSDLCGFVPSDNAEFAEIRENEAGSACLYAGLYAGSRPQYMGVSRNFEDGWSIKSCQSLTLRLRADAPESVSEMRLLLCLNTTQNGVITYEGSATLQNGVWETVTFDLASLRSLTDTVTDMRVLVCAPEQADSAGDYALWIDGISVTADRAASVWVVLLRIVSVLLLIGAAFYLFVLVCNIRTRQRRKKAAMRRRPGR